MRDIAVRALISLLTFVLGITAAALWSIGYFDNVGRPSVRADGWKKINIEGKATFYIPPDLKSAVLDDPWPHRVFYRDGMEVTMLYPNIRTGGTCINHTEENLSKHKVTRTTVAGRDATLLTLETAVFGYEHLHVEPLRGMTVCVPDVGDGEHEFNILARYKGGQDYEDVRRIIDSIKFH